MTLIQIQGKQSAGDALPLLRLGFRPFFLLAGMSAVALMLYWLYLINSGGVVTVYGVSGWHAHEMLFGFTVAVIAGFLLTAAKNWTNIQTLQGVWLAGFALLWVVGRVAPWLPLPAWCLYWHGCWRRLPPLGSGMLRIWPLLPACCNCCAGGAGI